MDKFFEIQYTGRIKRTGKVFDTTDEETAKEENIYNERFNYGSRIITEEGEVVDGVIEALEEMEEEEEKELEISSDKGYGKRDPSKVDMVPKKDFEDTKVNPVPGMQVILDGEPAKIQTVSGGRVRVDFNHPLAGRDLKYNLKILKVIEEDEEKAEGLTRKIMSLEEDEIEIKPEEEKITVKIPDEQMKDEKEELRDKLTGEIKEKTNYKDVEIKVKKE